MTLRDEIFLPDDHKIVKENKLIEKNFQHNLMQNIRVDIFFGIKNITTSNDFMWDPDMAGEIIFDDNFDFSEKKSQIDIRNFCDSLKKSKHVLNGEVDCVTNDFFKWSQDIKREKFPIESSFRISELLWEWASQTNEG